MGDEEREEIIEEDEEGGAKAEEAPSRPFTGKIIKILLYVAGGILLIVLVIGISYIVAKNVQESSYERRQDIIAAPPPAPLDIYELPDISRTTNDPEPHFLKVKIALAYEKDPLINNELISRKSQIQHIINIILQSKKYEDLNTVSGAVDLADEIKAHVNVILIAGKVKEVYFQEFVLN
ncbi:MAG: flagellar basal body-associated FliL family protein [Spirochaetes bacterium]|nr:flagellar basal body-associated FliL family protein [Spirochaetota bacterium]